jgi:hypothetical protein
MRVIERIEKRLNQNKKGVRTYLTHAAADAAAKRIAEKWDEQPGTYRPIDFYVVFIPAANRWTPVFDLSGWVEKNQIGSYLGFFADAGFFSV